MRVLVDTNVVLDVLLDRRPFAKAAARVFALVEESRIEGFLCATTVTTVDDLLGQALAPSEARAALQRLLDLFEIAPVNRPVLEQALRSDIADFEDAVLEQSARVVSVDVITTRNLPDFKKSSVTAYDPLELLSTVEAMESAIGIGPPPRGGGPPTPPDVRIAYPASRLQRSRISGEQ